MRRLSIASIAVDAPMGAQGYQERIAQNAQTALDTVSPSDPLFARRLIVRSLRSPLAGNRRLPIGYLSTASAAVRREVGRLLFASDAVSHRMNLELPPSPRGDVVTLHDVVAWQFPDESEPIPVAADELRRADAVICVSEFTADQASEMFGLRNVHVVHNGVDARFFDSAPLPPNELRGLGVADRYVLHSGGASARKNLAALADAWPGVRAALPDVTLLMTGPAHAARTSLFKHLPGVVLAGRLPDAVMPAIVAGAAAVVIPSLHEGFGLPAVEAMAAGVPVVAAATSSLPEVVGDAGLLVPPTATGLTRGLLDALSDSPDVDRLREIGRERAKRFSWEESARAHARIWSAVAA